MPSERRERFLDRLQLLCDIGFVVLTGAAMIGCVALVAGRSGTLGWVVLGSAWGANALLAAGAHKLGRSSLDTFCTGVWLTPLAALLVATVPRPFRDRSPDDRTVGVVLLVAGTLVGLVPAVMLIAAVAMAAALAGR